jgi:hypothetical protein
LKVVEVPLPIAKPIGGNEGDMYSLLFLKTDLEILEFGSNSL